jgi:SAM-dependent methyltransferase
MARTVEAILAGEIWCATWPAVTVGTVSLADAWEHHATDWIAWARTPDHDAFWDGTWPTLLEIMPDSAGLVLDLGCGEGRAGRQLLAAGRRVLGIERSATLARAAATGSPLLPVAQADAARLPLADGCAALVVASMSLLDIDDVEGAIAETARSCGRAGSSASRSCIRSTPRVRALRRAPSRSRCPGPTWPPGVTKIASRRTDSPSPWPACTGRSARTPRRCSAPAW